MRQVIKLPLIDLSVPDNKRKLIQSIGTLSGPYEVKIEPRREVGSARQRRYYFGCIVSSFSEFLRDQQYENCDTDFAHAILKSKFLQTDLINPETGEIIAVGQKSTTDLDTKAMTEYITKCRGWLEEQFGIIVPEP